MRRLLPTLQLLFLLFSVPVLTGFTGYSGVELEMNAGLGIGRIRETGDDDSYGEIGGQVRFKFRHFPYSDAAGWISMAGSWSTYPTGGNWGNRLVTLSYMGGILRGWGEVGGGLVLFGDTSEVGPMFILPAFHLRIGEHDRVMFQFGILDEAPFWSIGNFMHFEAILAPPFGKVWAPRLKIGGRVNSYSQLVDRVPIELALGVEGRFGRHLRVSVDGSLGDGGNGNLPSFSLAVRLGVVVGKGTKSGIKPLPVD